MAAPFSLSTATLRNLGHKEYEKRKQAALEVENLVRELRDSRDAHDQEKITALVAQLGTDLAESPQSNLRKGALHALAGTAIGLRQDVAKFLPQLLQPVLGSFSDQDARVRYYGCEALYNIAKVARAGCVKHFNPVFDGLFKLSADTDISVQNGMQLLDRLMKDVVTEADDFDIVGFMPLLKDRIYVSNPFSRQFLVGWISALDSVPDIDMLEHLPIFFDGLFHMLADPNKEIRQQTFSVLSEFLREIREADQLGVADLAPIVNVLVQHSSSQDKFSRLTALTWLHTFVTHGREQLMPYCAQVLNAILASLSHLEDEIREAAKQADAALRALLQQSAEAQFEMHTLLHALGGHLASQYVPTLLAALQWVHMLLQKSAPRVMQLSQQIWPALFQCLSNASEEVVRLDIEALAKMAPTEEHFGPLVEHLLHLFRKERALLEKRGALIVRQLCEHLAPRKVFVTLAGGLRAEEDLEFASQMVQQLNLILLTTPEAIELRLLLKQSSTQSGDVKQSGGGATLFQTLYPAWSHNPVALLSMCLLAQLHEHASELVLQFAEIEISVAFLLQIDKLVQLIESPIFTHVRLQLLEPEQHPYLLKALWGILMLLPQSPAFHTLKNRLAAVPEIGLLRLQLEVRKTAPTADRGGAIDFKSLLKTYRAVQEKHRSRLLVRQTHGRRASARE
tara:strand:+ start:220 stop:2259 length:2040 start_codon:yes stop_codon:yes gene_type:complete